MEYIDFKEKNWPDSRGRLTRPWRRIVGHDRSWSRFDLLMAIMASILRQISLDFCLKKTHDRATIVVLVVRRSPSPRMAAIPPRMLSNRCSIAPRSLFDRAAIVEFFHNSSRLFDQSSGGWRVTIARSREPRLRGSSAVRLKKISMMIAIVTPSVR